MGLVIIQSPKQSEAIIMRPHIFQDCPDHIYASRDVLDRNPVITADQLAESGNADPRVTRRALEELHAFVQQTLDELVKMENRGFGSSSLDQFCRIDVGLIQHNGVLQYFVNEVERGPNVGLWAGESWPHIVGEVAEKLAPVMHSWITGSK